MKTMPIKSFLTATLVASTSWAQTTQVKASSTSVLPFTGPNLNDVVLDSQLMATGSSTQGTTLDIIVSCFGTNLRSVPNPIAENSILYAKITYLTTSGSKTFEINFPATATMKNFASTSMDLTSKTTVVGNATEHLQARLEGNMIRINLSEAKTIPVDVLATGTDFTKLTDLATKSAFLSNITFRQTLPNNPPPTQFMAFDGPVSAASNWYASENGKSIIMLASFPGENHYCGGYFSPLVLKFDGDEVPKVDRSSNFPLYGTGHHKISWPTFEEQVYLLTLDLNNNGKVDGGNELFGDINNFQDGFKNLAEFDSNKDGVIDAKDPIFAKLKLWRDANHDGKSGKAEIKTLKEMGVESISLQYDGTMQAINSKAKVVGPGEFTYKDKKGDVKKGRVWDIFLKLIP